MLTGFLLLIMSVLFFLCGVVLPRIHEPLSEQLNQFGPELQQMAEAVMPAMAKIRLLLKWMIPGGRISLVLSAALLVLGIYAFIKHPVPALLSAAAYTLFLLVVAGIAGLLIFLRKLAPQMAGISSAMAPPELQKPKRKR